VDYKITIIEKGQERYRYIDIENVPYKVIKISQRIAKKISEVMAYSERVRELEDEIITLRELKSGDWKRDIDKKKSEISDITDKVFQVEDSGFFNERFEAIKLILQMNNIKENDELMLQDTWESKMNYADPMALIEFAINKDIKKAMAAVSASSTKTT